jgi:hypothetical protein
MRVDMMTKGIYCSITNVSRSGNNQGPVSTARKALIQLANLLLIGVTLAVGSGWGQSAFENSSLAGSSSMSLRGNSLDLPSTRLPAEPVAAVSPGVNLFPAAVAPKAPSHAKTWWILSGIALTASSMVDLGTSLGHNEANPALRGANGQVSLARGVSLKLGLSSVTILAQWLIARHRPELYGPSAVVNAVGAGAFGAVALHNANTPQ